MARGNFAISDYVSERVGLRAAKVRGAGWTASASASRDRGRNSAERLVAGGLPRRPPDPWSTQALSTINRLWLRTAAEAGEHVWGARRAAVLFRPARPPLPAVDLRARGRPRQVHSSDHLDGRSGSERAATISTPTIRSRPTSRRAATPCTSRPRPTAAFDFRHDAFHEIEVWEVPSGSSSSPRDTFVELVGALSDALRPPAAAAGLGAGGRDHRPQAGRRELPAAGEPMPERRRGDLGPLVRGLGGAAHHLLRQAPVLELEVERDPLSGPGPQDRRAGPARASASWAM
jgi:hypothetical protein